MEFHFTLGLVALAVIVLTILTIPTTLIIHGVPIIPTILTTQATTQTTIQTTTQTTPITAITAAIREVF